LFPGSLFIISSFQGISDVSSHLQPPDIACWEDRQRQLDALEQDRVVGVRGLEAISVLAQQHLSQIRELEAELDHIVSSVTLVACFFPDFLSLIMSFLCIIGQTT